MISDPIRVLLVDDQELVRVGLRMILETEEGIEVVGEAADGTAALALASELAPDVICMDLQMPGMDGLEATRRIVASGSAAGILVLTTFNRDDYLFDALKAGASGFVLKNATPESIVEAVQVVARGEALLSTEVTRTVIEHLVGGTAAGPRSPGRPPAEVPQLHDLTEREREVLGLLAAGRSNAEIARELYLGEATVKTHVSKILSKLGLRDRIQAVVFGYENGIVVPGVPPAG
ncbi:DNA-binding response regulator [Subtercola boreus]|uniref:DNA-binding response regulator n=1 Tax=Subtercola boreus TaxID=120213 RepID=A0A3E0VD36_9MICO|nr:response regulator transcription factor [Subtercola boreus]RFA07463.1 DNA-binding response regulator [Subtercola boreus]